MKKNTLLSERNEKVASVLDMLEKEFQVLTAIETGKILGGSDGVGTSCPFVSVGPVISSSDFVGWNDVASSNCKVHADAQMGVASCSAASWADSGSYQVSKQDMSTGAVTTYANAAAQGVDYINCQLQAQHPVEIGVNDGWYGGNEANSGSGMSNDGTDHFIVIVGCGVDSQGRQYYQFYDNATSTTSEGTSSNNRLYYDSASGTITGQGYMGNDSTKSASYDTTGENNQGYYQVTSIRRTIVN